MSRVTYIDGPERSSGGSGGASPGPSGWSPIIDAPVDTAVLLWASGYYIGHWNTARKCWVVNEGEVATHNINSFSKPTHFRLLPAPPQ
jgi:hypothetical protein